MFTLKLVSYADGPDGHPMSQVWVPGVKLVTRIGSTTAFLYRKEWALYSIDHDYVVSTKDRFTAPQHLEVGQIVDYDDNPMRVRLVHGQAPDADKYMIDLESIDGQTGIVRGYDPNAMVRLLGNDLSEALINMSLTVSLLWVVYDDHGVHMAVERAYLLGPNGGTVDRICA